MPELSERIRQEAFMTHSPVWDARPLEAMANEVKTLKEEHDAWKEAFLATRAYYSNNNGPNSTRYRAAIKQLKEMKLIK